MQPFFSPSRPASIEEYRPAHIDAEDAIAFAAMRTKECYNYHHKPIFFKQGDLVRLRLHRGYRVTGMLSKKLGQQLIDQKGISTHIKLLDIPSANLAQSFISLSSSLFPTLTNDACRLNFNNDSTSNVIDKNKYKPLVELLEKNVATLEKNVVARKKLANHKEHPKPITITEITAALLAPTQDLPEDLGSGRIKLLESSKEIATYAASVYQKELVKYAILVSNSANTARIDNMRANAIYEFVMTLLLGVKGMKVSNSGTHRKGGIFHKNDGFPLSDF